MNKNTVTIPKKNISFRYPKPGEGTTDEARGILVLDIRKLKSVDFLEIGVAELSQFQIEQYSNETAQILKI